LVTTLVFTLSLPDYRLDDQQKKLGKLKKKH